MSRFFKVQSFCVPVKCDLSMTVLPKDYLFGNCLFRAVKLTKNADIDKYKYSRYGTRFDRRGTFLCHSSGFGCNIIIFGVYKSSSIHNNIHNDNINCRKKIN